MEFVAQHFGGHQIEKGCDIGKVKAEVEDAGPTHGWAQHIQGRKILAAAVQQALKGHPLTLGTSTSGGPFYPEFDFPASHQPRKG